MADSESEILVSRFRPEQQARVAADLKREDALLRRYIETGQLDFWFKNVLASVKTESVSNANTDGKDAESSPSAESKARLTWV